MQQNTIFVKTYHTNENLFPIKKQEILRYAGYRGTVDELDEELKQLLEQVMEELENAFSYKVCYRRMKIEWKSKYKTDSPNHYGNPKMEMETDSKKHYENAKIEITEENNWQNPEIETTWHIIELPTLSSFSKSKDLTRCLSGSNEIVLFSATIGFEIDRYIAKYQRISPAKALLAQAYGAERIECLCDVFCKELKAEVAKEGFSCTARFSPGYGDFPLSAQKEVFQLLDCSRQIGVTLNDSLLMMPSKSVTAIFGIGSCVERQTQPKCKQCGKTNCIYKNEI